MLRYKLTPKLPTFNIVNPHMQLTGLERHLITCRLQIVVFVSFLKDDIMVELGLFHRTSSPWALVAGKGQSLTHIWSGDVDMCDGLCFVT